MIYLDHAATTPLDPRVLDAMMPYLTDQYGNPGALHSCGRMAKKAVDRAREQVAAFFNCEPSQVVFTSGGSEGNNMVFFGTAPWFLKNHRNCVLVSAVEHDSVRRAAKEMCIKHGFDRRILTPDSDGEITLSNVKAAAEFLKNNGENIGLLSVMLANNETGVVNDIHDIARYAHEQDILIHTDAVQAAGCLSLDTKELFPVDFMTVSSHKINGPKGVGALFVSNPRLISPLIYGGADQEFGLRGGTENVAGIVGFGEACELTSKEYAQHFLTLWKLRSSLESQLKRLALASGVSLRINGDTNNALPKTLNVCFPGVDAEALLLLLDAHGIFVSAGSACRSHESEPSHVLKAMGLSDEDARCSIRISLSHTNTLDEIDEAAAAIINAAHALLSV